MPPPANLPDALLQHAALGREEPWLFQAEGWDWRWQSWGEAADRMLRWAERLAAIPAGSRAAYRYVPRSAEVILDLAIQAARLVSLPVSTPFAEREAAFWIGFQGDELRITEPSPSGLRQGPGNEVGGALVIRNGEAVEWTTADLLTVAERLREEIPSRVGEQEIVVLGGALEDSVERGLMAWATVAGAAVVLEPNPALRAATAAWVRPTLFHGTREEIAALRSWAEKEKPRPWRRSPRLPFRRLRALLVTHPEALTEEDAAFWRERGVRVLPQSGISVVYKPAGGASDA